MRELRLGGGLKRILLKWPLVGSHTTNSRKVGVGNIEHEVHSNSYELSIPPHYLLSRHVFP